jgi:hypothetical protein
MSCQEFCEEFDRTAIVVNFYSAVTGELMPVTLTVTGIENDKELYSSSQFSQLLLPINPAADMMSFLIQKGDEPADIITFHYIRQPRLVSPECGCVSYAEIIHVEVQSAGIQNETDDDADNETENEITQTIVHFEITNPNVTTVSYRPIIVNEENIRIYY